jgi:hypothetical protein
MNKTRTHLLYNFLENNNNYYITSSNKHEFNSACINRETESNNNGLHLLNAQSDCVYTALSSETQPIIPYLSSASERTCRLQF